MWYDALSVTYTTIITVYLKLPRLTLHKVPNVTKLLETTTIMLATYRHIKLPLLALPCVWLTAMKICLHRFPLLYSYWRSFKITSTTLSSRYAQSNTAQSLSSRLVNTMFRHMQCSQRSYTLSSHWWINPFQVHLHEAKMETLEALCYPHPPGHIIQFLHTTCAYAFEISVKSQIYSHPRTFSHSLMMVPRTPACIQNDVKLKLKPPTQSVWIDITPFSTP